MDLSSNDLSGEFIAIHEDFDGSVLGCFRWLIIVRIGLVGADNSEIGVSVNNTFIRADLVYV